MPKVKAREWSGQSATWWHAKLDGHYTRIVKDSCGLVTAFTSRPVDITEKVKHLLGNVARNVPCGTVLLGELHAPGYFASSVKTLLNESNEALRITYFAIESWAADFSLEGLHSMFELWGLPFATYGLLTSRWLPEELLTRARENGWEGMVLKDGNTLNWWKLKEERTIDAVVTGITDGDGKYLGLIGSLRCSVYGSDNKLHEIANASGFTDFERMAFTEHEPLGQVVKLRYQYVGSKGRLRHPAFKRLRDNKLPQECATDQDVTLQEYWNNENC